MGKLLVVGSVALDTVRTPFGEAREVLGGSATYFATAASYFTEVGLIAVIGDDFPDQHLTFLKSRGIDLAGLERRPGRTFRWAGEYTYQLNEAHTLDTRLNVFETFRPKIPTRTAPQTCCSWATSIRNCNGTSSDRSRVPGWWLAIR